MIVFLLRTIGIGILLDWLNKQPWFIAAKAKVQAALTKAVELVKTYVIGRFID